MDSDLNRGHGTGQRAGGLSIRALPGGATALRYGHIALANLNAGLLIITGGRKVTGRRVLIIQGHPDPLPSRLCRVLADRYAAAAVTAGHQVRVIDVATLDFPTIRSSAQFYAVDAPTLIREAQADVEWCEHIALFFPVWLGTMPALLKGFFEQLFRPWFTLPVGGVVGRDSPRLGGRSLRMVTTMGMPALIYRVIFGAQGLHAFSRNLKVFTGIGPTRKSMIGNTEREPKGIDRRLRDMDALGSRAI